MESDNETSESTFDFAKGDSSTIPRSSQLKDRNFNIQGMLIAIAALGALLAPVAHSGVQGLVVSVFLLLAGCSYGSWGWKGLASCACVFAFLLGIANVTRGGADAARRTACANNIRWLMIAIHAYHDEHAMLPPRFSVDANGKPLHSWRVLILPYLGEEELYQLIDLEKPWNAPENVQYHDRMPAVFCCPSADQESNPSTTSYLAVYGEGTAWPDDRRVKLEDISNADGTSTTAGIVEANFARSNWMSPYDIHIGQLTDLSPDGSGRHFVSGHKGSNVVFFDGSVHLVTAEDPIQQLYSMATMDGGEDVWEY